MTTTATELAATYFEAWQAKDLDRLRSIFADDVSFKGPMGEVDDAAGCAESLGRLADMMDGPIAVQRRWVDGDDVITWFDLTLQGTGPMPVCNWAHVEGGKITRIRVTFDPRPIFEAAG